MERIVSMNVHVAMETEHVTRKQECACVSLVTKDFSANKVTLKILFQRIYFKYKYIE